MATKNETDAETAPEAEDPRVARSRAKLLTAATELLVEAGPQAVTVDAIAERSGVAKSTLYRHWASRDELLVAVMRACAPDVAPPDLTAGFEAALRQLLHGIAATFADPEWARIMPALLTLRSHSPELADLVDADHEAKLEAVAAMLELGVAEGRPLAGLSARRAVHLLVGPLMFGAISGECAHGTDLAGLADQVADTFLAAHPCPPTGPPPA